MLKVVSVGLVLLAVALSQVSDIELPPSIVKSPQAETIFRSDQPIVLECEGSGGNTLTYSWKKNLGDLNLKDRLNVERNGAKVTVQYGRSIDEGFYQCIVSSQYGRVMSNTSHLRRAFMDILSNRLIRNQTVSIGQPFTIIAQLPKSYPKPTYRWEVATSAEDDYPTILSLNSRIQMDDNGDLHFAYAIPSDSQLSRIYKLVSSNHYLDQKLSSSYTRVSVVGNLTDLNNFLPKHQFPTQTTFKGVVGRQISLRCFFAANPPARYQWSRARGAYIDPGRTEYSADDTVLTIKGIKLEDGGDYICRATNVIGTGSVTLHLLIEEAATFKNPLDGPTNQNITEENHASFTCNASGIPEPKVEWYMNGDKLSADNLKQPRMRITNNNTLLTIDDVCKDCEGPRNTDLMVIQCNSSNEHGYVLGTGYLNVLKSSGTYISGHLVAFIIICVVIVVA